MDVLAELFTRPYSQRTSEHESLDVPLRSLPDTVSSATSARGESSTSLLSGLRARVFVQKRANSSREIGDMSLCAIAKAMMLKEDGVPIENRHSQNSFARYDFVSWLMREFNDVSTRAEAVEWGVKLVEQGLFERCFVPEDLPRRYSTPSDFLDKYIMFPPSDRPTLMFI